MGGIQRIFDDELLGPDFSSSMADVLKVESMQQVVSQQVYETLIMHCNVEISKPVIDVFVRSLSQQHPRIMQYVVENFLFPSNHENRLGNQWQQMRDQLNKPATVLAHSIHGLPEIEIETRQLMHEFIRYSKATDLTPQALRIWTLVLTGDMAFENKIASWFQQLSAVEVLDR